MRSIAALAAGAAFLVISAPAAVAEPLPVEPGPGPVPGPVPVPTITDNGTAVGSQGTGVESSSTGMGTSAESSTTASYVNPLTNVPNINGDPCTGAWESVVCYSMQQGNVPVVQPRSTISSSP